MCFSSTWLSIAENVCEIWKWEIAQLNVQRRSIFTRFTVHFTPLWDYLSSWSLELNIDWLNLDVARLGKHHEIRIFYVKNVLYILYAISIITKLNLKHAYSH